MSILKIWNINWEVDTAGPSPDMNNRVELFLKGCNKALKNPCKGCFNEALWNTKTIKQHNVSDVAKQIIKHAPNKYITIGGGEPLDQVDGLIELCKKLKENDFHIIAYTHYELKAIFNDKTKFKSKVFELLNYIDILIDGPYVEKLKIYDIEKDNGLYNSVGSSNQIVWDIQTYNSINHSKLIGYSAEQLDALTLAAPDNKLIYIVKNQNVKSESLLMRKVG